LAGTAAGAASCFVFRGHQLLVSATGGLPVTGRQQLGARPPLRMFEFLGPAGEPCLVAEFEREREPPPGHRFEHLKALLDTLPAATRSAAARALELLEFDRT
ncbi:NUDIX-like domain-containing protein, partial [Arthrospira platensis SPKY1]|nr:NUDIX-like domain-containing protein [Arthrospira platensis SPKY1]